MTPIAAALAAVPERVAANLSSSAIDTSPAVSNPPRAGHRGRRSSAEWVFEAAPEKLELKRPLFRPDRGRGRRRTVIATNTSVIVQWEIAADVRARRQRMIGTHWWNPPFLVPLVEVVQAPNTSEET